jgi:hypothetical protein
MNTTYPGAFVLLQLNVAQLLALVLPVRDDVIVLLQVLLGCRALAKLGYLVVVHVEGLEVAELRESGVQHPALILPCGSLRRAAFFQRSHLTFQLNVPGGDRRQLLSDVLQ